MAFRAMTSGLIREPAAATRNTGTTCCFRAEASTFLFMPLGHAEAARAHRRRSVPDVCPAAHVEHRLEEGGIAASCRSANALARDAVGEGERDHGSRRVPAAAFASVDATSPHVRAIGHRIVNRASPRLWLGGATACSYLYRRPDEYRFAHVQQHRSTASVARAVRTVSNQDAAKRLPDLYESRRPPRAPP